MGNQKRKHTFYNLLVPFLKITVFSRLYSSIDPPALSILRVTEIQKLGDTRQSPIIHKNYVLQFISNFLLHIMFKIGDSFDECPFEVFKNP